MFPAFCSLCTGMKIHIYVLIEPNTDIVRYVGKSNEFRIENRLIEHCRPSALKFHTHKNYWIKSLLKEGTRPLLKVIETCDESSYKEREKYWVQYYRQHSEKPLTNGTEGGEGAIRIPNRIITEEQKKKISETWKRHPKFLEICSMGGKANRGIKRKFKFKQTSSYVGINRMTWGSWRAYIQINGKPFHLGSFKTEQKAWEAREKKRIELGLKR